VKGVKRLLAAINHHQLERLHTYETSSNRYYNPPARVPSVGRALAGTEFHKLVSELGDDEVLIGVYRNQVNALGRVYNQNRIMRMLTAYIIAAKQVSVFS
jgi:hypothetical protein